MAGKGFVGKLELLVTDVSEDREDDDTEEVGCCGRPRLRDGEDFRGGRGGGIADDPLVENSGLAVGIESGIHLLTGSLLWLEIRGAPLYIRSISTGISFRDKGGEVLGVVLGLRLSPWVIEK